MKEEKEKLSQSEKRIKQWADTIVNLEWKVLHHALNIARLESGGYYLDGDGRWNVSGNRELDLDGERLMLSIESMKLLQARELSVNNEHLSEGLKFITPP